MAVPIGIEELLATQVVVPRATRIYVMKDPRGGAVRYVGKTVRPLVTRLRAHLGYAKTVAETHLARWLRSLVSQGMMPIIEQIDIAFDDWADRERHWIATYRTMGADLTNATDGGEGTVGCFPSEETRALLSKLATGRRLSEEAKIKVGIAARNRSPESRALMSASSRGRKVSDETRARKSAAMMGKECSDQKRELCRIAKLGSVHSLSSREKMRESALKIPSETRKRMAASRDYGKLSPEHVAALVAANTGRKHTPESKALMSAARRRTVEAKRLAALALPSTFIE